MLKQASGRRAIGVAVGGVALALAVAMPASAAFHLIKISEVGQGGDGQVDYVELQMYASGQNLVGGKTVKTYDDAGVERSTFTLPTGVPSGESQRTILIVRDSGGGEPAAIADFLTPDLILTTGGAVCFGESFGPGQAIDCMAYGTFAGFAGGAPSPVGAPAPEIPPGGALQRSLTPGCATFLEAGDDTDSSAADFSLAAPSPRNNATAPTEVPCAGGGGGDVDDDPPQTTITKAPDRLTKARAKLKFASSEAGSSFRCSLDGKRFKPCDSPFRKRVDEGRHKFKVFAIDAAGNADPTPDKAKFKRVD